MTPRPRRTALTVLRGGGGHAAGEDLDGLGDLEEVDVSADPFADREVDDPLLGVDHRVDRSGEDDPDDPDGEGRWLAARGRWGVPVMAAAALLVLAAVVALVLGVRAGVLAPGDGAAAPRSTSGQEASGRPDAGAGRAAGGPATVERTGPVVGGAVGGPTRQPGAGPPPASESAGPGGRGAGPGGPPAGGPAAGAPLTVHVVGAVVAPGVVTVPAGSRAVDAVAAAGGMTPEADPAGVNLARSLADGEQVVVPRPGQAVPAAPVAGGAPAGGGVPAAPAAPLDVNTASAPELDALPGIGPVLAGRIVETRDAHGPFASVEELVEVPGIGDAVLERLRPLVRV